MPRLGTLSVGCAMWANRSWIGRYLPARTKPGQELHAYSAWCTAVEGNTTFYATPTVEVAAGWASQVGGGFRFVCKLPKSVTHDRRLRNTSEEMRPFLDAMTALAEVSGPLAVQLPASFGPDDLDVLLRFLDQRSAAFSWAVEVRNPGFFGGADEERRLNDELHARGVDRIIMDTRALFDGPRETPEEHDAFVKKPRLEVRPVALGQQPVVRFIGQRDLRENRRYWDRWVLVIDRWLRDGRSPIVFLHTPDNVDAPRLVRQFHAAVADRTPIPPLPTPLVDAEQTTLFDA